MVDPCDVPRCKSEADLVYLGHGICNRHWDEFTRNDASPDALRMALGIGEAHEIQEDPVMSKSKKQTQSTEAKAAKKERKPKAEKGELRTLALRVTNDEFDLVHKAAGPRNLTGFMKTAVMTAAQKSLAK